MRQTLIISAYAKINAALWVKARRKDGFHELETIFQTVSLCDTIAIKETSESGIYVFCSDKTLPCDKSNLAYKAALVFLEKTKIEPKIAINIEKRIPVSAGLAGGSADAAAVLNGLNKIYNSPLTFNELLEAASVLGSDVPFAVRGGFALARGRGEVLSFFDGGGSELVVVIAVPKGISVSTKWAYENYSPGNNENKQIAFNNAVEAYKARSLTRLRKNIFNDLESVTLQRYPQVQAIKEALLSAGEGAVLMSGSGPSVFGLFYDKKSALRAAEQLKGINADVYLERTVSKYVI